MSLNVLGELLRGAFLDMLTVSPMTVSSEAPPAKTDGNRLTVGTLTLDVIERMAVLTLCVWLFVRLVAAGLNFGSALLAISEGINVILIIIRRPSGQVSRRPGEWLLAVGGTTAVLLVYPTDPESALVPMSVASIPLMIGLLTQIIAKLALGRSFGLIPANRGLKLSGPYRVVRHPMYLGYFLVQIGFLLLNPSLWNMAVYVLAYSFQIPRLLAEERILAKDDAYIAYQQQVRYRMIPGVF